MASKLRIDFQVREITDDGSEGRFVTFGSDVSAGMIKDFFERCGLGVDTMFANISRLVGVRFKYPPRLKIEAIKVLRSITQQGLKEAKDMVESPAGTVVCVFKDAEQAREARQLFTQACVDVELVDVSPLEAVGAWEAKVRL